MNTNIAILLDGMRFHHDTQNGVQFKMIGLFILGIIQLIFLDHSGPWITETVESKLQIRRDDCIHCVYSGARGND